MFICVHVCAYVHMCVCMYISTCTHTHTHRNYFAISADPTADDLLLDSLKLALFNVSVVNGLGYDANSGAHIMCICWI